MRKSRNGIHSAISVSLPLMMLAAVLLVSSCATTGGKTAPADGTPVRDRSATNTVQSPADGSGITTAPAAQAAAPLPPDAVITWTEDALALFKQEVPFFVQKVAKKESEKKARERGVSVIDLEFYNEIKKESGH